MAELVSFCARCDSVQIMAIGLQEYVGQAQHCRRPRAGAAGAETERRRRYSGPASIPAASGLLGGGSAGGHDPIDRRQPFARRTPAAAGPPRSSCTCLAPAGTDDRGRHAPIAQHPGDRQSVPATGHRCYAIRSAPGPCAGSRRHLSLRRGTRAARGARIRGHAVQIRCHAMHTRLRSGENTASTAASSGELTGYAGRWISSGRFHVRHSVPPSATSAPACNRDAD